MPCLNSLVVPRSTNPHPLTESVGGRFFSEQCRTETTIGNEGTEERPSASMAELLGVMLPLVERLAKLRLSEGVLQGESLLGEEWRLCPSSSIGVERPDPVVREGDGVFKTPSLPLLCLRFLGLRFSNMMTRELLMSTAARSPDPVTRSRTPV